MNSDVLFREQVKTALERFTVDGDMDRFFRYVQALAQALALEGPASRPVAPFEVILLATDSEFARELLYEVQEWLNTGEHGRAHDKTTRCDWNGKPRRFEVFPHEVRGSYHLTVETSSLEEAVVLRQIATDRFNLLFKAKLKSALEVDRLDAALPPSGPSRDAAAPASGTLKISSCNGSLTPLG